MNETLKKVVEQTELRTNDLHARMSKLTTEKDITQYTALLNLYTAQQELILRILSWDHNREIQLKNIKLEINAKK